MKDGLVMEQQTSLEKLAAKVPDVITTAEQYQAAQMLWLESKVNLLTPFSQIGGLAAGHGIRWTQVVINVDPAAEEVSYGPQDAPSGKGLPFLKKGEVAPAKRGLRKIAEALALRTRLEYISVGPIRNYFHVKAIASYTGVDGTEVVREASQVWDLQDGSERLKGFTKPQIEEARKHGLRNCETRAINAVIRECGAGVKQKYTVEELKRPFVAIHVSVMLDMNNPETRARVEQRALSGSSALYPGLSAPPANLAPPADPFADAGPVATPRTVGSGVSAGATTRPASPAGSGSSAAGGDAPPVEGAVRIVDVKRKPGETNGNKWLKFTITDSNSEECSTLDAKVGEKAEEHLKSGAWVELAVVLNGKYRNLEEISPAGQNPGLPGLENL